VTESLPTVIARVRRAMPRNSDVMAICDAAERVTLPPSRDTPAVTLPSKGVTLRCPVCEARRAADVARTRRHRASRRVR
jgi:hypothetical protein